MVASAAEPTASPTAAARTDLLTGARRPLTAVVREASLLRPAAVDVASPRQAADAASPHPAAAVVVSTAAAAAAAVVSTVVAAEAAPMAAVVVDTARQDPSPRGPKRLGLTAGPLLAPEVEIKWSCRVPDLRLRRYGPQLLLRATTNSGNVQQRHPVWRDRTRSTIPSRPAVAGLCNRDSSRSSSACPATCPDSGSRSAAPDRDHCLRIAALVMVRGLRERHIQRRPASRTQLRHGTCAGAAQQQVSPRQSPRLHWSEIQRRHNATGIGAMPCA